MTDPQGGVPSYVYDTLNLGSPTKIWPIPGVLKSSSRASHSSSFESACYANVEADLVWVQMGATSVFSAGSSKPMPTITSPLTPTTLKIICSASKMRMTTRHRSATTHTAELCKPLFPTHYGQYGYDAVNNLTSKTDRNGQTIGYVYDDLYRLTQKNYPNSTNVEYVYDLVGKLQQVDLIGFFAPAGVRENSLRRKLACR